MAYYLKKIIFCFLFVIIIQFPFIVPAIGRNFLNHNNASWNNTIKIYKNVPCLSEDEYNYGKDVIKGLDYNSSRIFRKLCEFPDISFSKSKTAWSALLRYRLSYEQVLIFETWGNLPDVDIDVALTALPVIQSLSYETGKSFQRYCLIPKISAIHALNIIPLLQRLDDSGNRAAQALFSITDISASFSIDGLGILIRLTPEQSIAAEAFAKIKDMNSITMLESLALIRQFQQDNAWNAHTLWSSQNITRKDAWNWLTSYFATTPDIQEQLFYTLSLDQKKILLDSFYQGGTEIIWRINDLHSITDRFGIEISKNELQKTSNQQLISYFEKLTPQIKVFYAKHFYTLSEKGKKSEMIELLRTSTAAARFSTAEQLVSANIYALLAQGSELYDSSFRNILVPILIKRIEKKHNNNLLVFLNDIDPENLFVSDFIVSLAQKGKLTEFFPTNHSEQKEILKLVTQSAFRDKDSIILFSATFTQLLQLLEPTARNFLLEQMIIKSESKNIVYAKLIRVILQYYHEEFPELLSEIYQQKILILLKKYNKVNLSVYLKTPFKEWISDNQLQALSIFHPDDDGYDSFLSFTAMLLKNKYKLSFSQQFSVSNIPDATKLKLEKFIAAINSAPDKNLSKLFYSLQRNRFSVTFNKKVNNINISHSVFIYSDENIQAKLFELFILNGVEMFAQRGHSYWRSEQLIEPLEKLLDTKKISNTNLMNKQRFLSLGSCGGVKAYTRLHNLFLGKVDMLATIGTGIADINDPYNKNLFEIIANNNPTITWKDIERLSASIFSKGHGRDYLQPGSLPAILHKIINETKTDSIAKTSPVE